MSKKGKGWHKESHRHSLAGRGIKTGQKSQHKTAISKPRIKKSLVKKKGMKGIKIVPTPYFRRKSTTEVDKKGMAGGFYEIHLDGKEIGRSDFVAHYKDVKYPFGNVIPKDTATITSIEMYEDKHRGKGYGSYLFEYLEDEASKMGMKRMWITNVENPEFFEKRGYKHTGTARIYEKRLE